MTLDSFARKYMGRFPDFDGYFGAQCVDLIQFYNKEVVGNKTRFYGNAADLLGQSPGGKYTRGNKARRGAIAVYPRARDNGNAGHVSIMLDSGTKSLNLNYPTGSGVAIRRVYAKPMGYLYPKSGPAKLTLMNRVYRRVFGRNVNAREFAKYKKWGIPAFERLAKRWKRRGAK